MSTGLLVQRAAATLFLDEREKGPFKISSTTGGINNIVHYCDCKDGSRYVLRIYNNGQNHGQVQYEHAVLKELNKLSLSFAIPVALPRLSTTGMSRAANSSITHVILDTGDDACMWECIPGTELGLKYAFEFGVAAGELSTKLSQINVSSCSSPNAPYYEIYKVHHAVDKDMFYETLRASPHLEHVRSNCEYIAHQVRSIEALTMEILSLDIPKQIVHGDLVYNNVLCDENTGKITGLIDFEFASMDWRAMELAVCLSKYASQEERWKLFDDFTRGFSLYGVLSDVEIQYVPDLICLRLVSNIVYFVGRALAGEDKWSTVVEKMLIYEDRLNWTQENKGTLLSLLHRYFSAARMEDNVTNPTTHQEEQQHTNNV